MASTHTISSLDLITGVAFNDAMPTDNTNSLDIFGAPITQKYTAMQMAQYAWRAYVVYGGTSTKINCAAATDIALTATYANGTLGVGATLTNSGTQAALTLDGYAVAVNDRVLVWKQAAPEQNGIYTVTTIGDGSSNWMLTRATDYDQSAEITLGTNVGVVGGNTLVGGLFVMYSVSTITVGTTAIYFKFIGGTVIGATTAFTMTGTGIFAPVISGDTAPTFAPGAYTVLGSGQNIVVNSIVTGTITLVNGTVLTSSPNLGSNMGLAAYDTTNSLYRVFATFTSGAAPTMAIAAPTNGTISIDGAVIGATTPAAAKFTTITSNSLTFNNGTGIKTSQTVGNTAALSAYDTTNSIDRVFVTFTAGTAPTMAIAAPTNSTATMNGVVIGGVTPLAGSFTALTATGATITAGTGSATYSPLGIINADLTAVSNTDSSEDVLITYTLPANTLVRVGQVLKIKVEGTTASNTNAKSIKTYFGTTVMRTDTIPVSTLGAWAGEFTIKKTSLNHQSYTYSYWHATATGVAAFATGSGTMTETETATIVIKCGGTGVAANDITQISQVVESN